MIQIKRFNEKEEYFNTNFLSDLYDQMNREYFNNRLDKYPIEIRTLKNTLAKVVAKRYRDSGIIEIEKIVFSNMIDFSLDELKGIMVHEMIHVFMLENGETEKRPHGRLFQDKLKYYNSITPFEVSETEDVTSKKVTSVVGRKEVIVVIPNHRKGVMLFNASKKDTIVEEFKSTFPKGWLDRYEFTLVLSDDPELQKYPIKRKVSQKGFNTYTIGRDKVEEILRDGTLLYQF